MMIKAMLLIAFVSVLAQQPATAASPLDGLDAYVHKAMHEWQVPGMAVAVVKDGKVVMARGYGVRELGKPEKVDADTIFDIGSNTKSFTAAALGILVKQGKLRWDARVVDHVKNFRLRSPYITQELTLRDLLSHRSGYCDPGAMWYTSNDDDAIYRMRYQEPEYGFRAHFCYNNMMYLTAARFIPSATGQSWNDFVAEHLFKPLGMNHSVTTDAEVAAAPDVAAPHGLIDGKPAMIGRYWGHNMDIASPVGGIYSSANDMSRWLLMLLGDGRYDGKTILDKSIVEAMQTPQIPVPADSGVGHEIREWMSGGRFYSYGLGLLMQEYAGHKLVWHAGDIDGMASAMAIVPDENVGVVVLTNMNEAGARFGVLMRVIDSYLGNKPRDVSAMLLAMDKKQEKAAKAAEAKLAATRQPRSKPPRPLKDYAGKYNDKFNGPAKVSLDSGYLVLRLGNPDFTGDLEHWHGNTFRVTWRHRFYGKTYVTFDQDVTGKPVKISFVGPPLHFERVPKKLKEK